MIKIGVIGNGFVGKATKLLECDDINIISYDKNPALCQPLGITINDLSGCEFIFISVPINIYICIWTFAFTSNT